MRKKIILLILLIFPIFVNAEEKTTFSLNEITAAPGTTVTIKLNIANNPEFGVLTSRIKFDNSKLEYVSGKLTGLKSASIKGLDKNKNKGLIAVYAISIGDKMSDTGDIATMEFKISDSIKEKTDIPLTLEIVDFGINEDKPLEYQTKNGIIHINPNTENVTTQTKESLKEKYQEKIKESNTKEEDVTWSSSDDNIAKVDDGAIEFKEDGNVTIEARDKEGNIVYSKDYYVKEKSKNNKSYKHFIIIGIIVIVTIIILFWRKKWKRKK